MVRLLIASLLVFVNLQNRAHPAERPPWPDLAVEAEEIVFPKNTVLQGTSVLVELTVRNLGNAEAAPFDVKAWDLFEGRRQFLKTFPVAALPPLASVVLTFDWKPEGQGVHQIMVTADPDGKVQEPDRGNNSSTKEVLVLSTVHVLTNLYAFALDYTSPGSVDRRLLEAERDVFLDPRDPEAQQQLLQVAVDWERERIVVIGLGLRPFYIVSDAAAQPLARRAAKLDAQRWLSWIQQKRASGKNLKGQVFGARILAEQELPDGSFMVKMEAPLP